MEIQFGIHQELWQDAWIAATSAVRARKRQIDLNVEQRIQRLVAEYGPKTQKPLTLRVYGTMLKGFCVINNDRAKALHGDCERLVLLFAQPFSSREKDLRPAKRQRVEAVTLELDLAKVKEAEAFDWTQAPLGDALLSLDLEELEELREVPEVPEATAPTLEEGLEVFDLTEAFGAGAAPMPQPMPEALEPAAPVPAIPEIPEISGIPDGAEVAHRREKRRRQLPPGHVIGFDVDTQLPEQELEVSLVAGMLATYAQDLRMRAETLADHLGPLWVLERPAAGPGAAVAGVLGVAGVALDVDMGGFSPDEVPEVQPLLDAGPEAIGAIFAEAPEAAAFVAAAERAAEAAEAAEAAATEAAEAAEAAEAEVSPFDAQTAQVGLVIRRFVEKGPANLDDLISPGYTQRATAARTFAALLALATGGGIQVNQKVPYGPISIALA